VANSDSNTTNTVLQLFLHLLFQNLHGSDPDSYLESDFFSHFDVATLSDYWSAARRMFYMSVHFRDAFLTRKYHHWARSLLMWATRSFFLSDADSAEGAGRASEHGSIVRNRLAPVRVWLRLVYSCLHICLKCKSFDAEFDSEV
jgi:hypothetical protein